MGRGHLLRLLFYLTVAGLAPCGIGRAQVAGDANCDGVRDDADVEALVDRLFVAPPPGTTGCRQADVNADGRVSSADLIAQFSGPRITFIGLAGADGRAVSSLGTLPDGTPVYFNNAGFGFNLVIEAAPSRDGTAVGIRTRNGSSGDPSVRPDLQVEVDQLLGEGSGDICDDFGVPAVTPLDFSLAQHISDALNDLGCRFVVATNRGSTCTLDGFGQSNFVSRSSRVQFCFAVSRFAQFHDGETQVSVQVRDEEGKLSALRRMMLRVQRGPIPATFTPPPPTPTRTPTFTPTASETPTDTRTVTPTRTATPTRTHSATPVDTATRTLTRTRTGTPVLAATPTRTAPSPSSGSATPTSRVSPSRTNTATRTPTGPTATRTTTRTRTPTGGRTPTRTRTRTRTRTPSPTFTATVRPTPTRTRTTSPTPDAAQGPAILFFGVLRPDDVILPPDGMANGIPFYVRPFGFGFSLVVEAGSGESRRTVGSATFAGFGRPDLQVQVTRPLGNGSAAVCDNQPPILGGVPAINPPNLGEDPSLDDRLNDFGCRFVDGQDRTQGRSCAEDQACIRFDSGVFGCFSAQTRQQFCAAIGNNLEFPIGETMVTVRVRDTFGNLGPPARLIIRVVPP
jgi:hypothetical protein